MGWSNWFWVVLFIYAAGCITLNQGGHWLMFYMWGATGLTLLIVYLSFALGWETWLEGMEINHTQWVLSPLFLTNRNSGNTLLVPDPTGWSLLSIGVECSAVIEAAALLGLILFYPRFKPFRKVIIILVGLVATYVLNIFRLAVIAIMTHFIGKQAVMVAHTIVGRLLFFVGVVAIYWFLITKPTLTLIAQDIKERVT